MKVSENSIIGEIVALNYKTSSVFSSRKIDFCCNGNRTIKEGAESANANLNEILNQLDLVLNTSNKTSDDFDGISLTDLIDHILNHHHTYVAKSSIEIVPFLEKISKVHGTNHPELKEIEQEFKSAVGELAMHMKKEELILFPYIKKLEMAFIEKATINKSMFDSVASPIESMKHEHSVEGDRFAKISRLSNDYSIPEDGCSTYQVTYKLLKEFEQDLHRHIHLENNILFEKAIQLEAEYRALNLSFGN